MRPRTVLLALGLTLIVSAAWWVPRAFFPDRVPVRLKSASIESAPMCPWREPEEDLRLMFPGASTYRDETRILSGVRPELAKRLGRLPSAEENALRVHRVYTGENDLGAILVRRVKGEHGAIELVVAVTEEGTVRGLRLQRLREPESIARILQEPGWLASFTGKTATNHFKLEEDVPGVATEARASAEAVTDGMRSLLVLFEMSNERLAARTHH